MITPELQKYITDSRAAGSSDEQIKSSLLAQGWAENDIKNIFVFRIGILLPITTLIYCLTLVVFLNEFFEDLFRRYEPNGFDPASAVIITTLAMSILFAWIGFFRKNRRWVNISQLVPVCVATVWIIVVLIALEYY